MLHTVYMHEPSPTKAIVRTPAGRSEEDRSSPTNAPRQAEYNNRKHSSISALVGMQGNDPRARETGIAGETGESPLFATAVAACAGENAGANAIIAANMIVRRCLYPLLRTNPDAHLIGAVRLRRNDGRRDRRDLGVCLAFPQVDVRRVLVYLSTPTVLVTINRDATPVLFVGCMMCVVLAPNLGDVSPNANPECRMNNAAANIEVDCTIVGFVVRL